MAILSRLNGFIAALQRRDVDAAVDYFTDDGVYQEAGALALVGRGAIAACLAGFIAIERPWDFVIDQVITNTDAQRAAVLYRFVIDSGSEQAQERSGCVIITQAGDRFASWREYAG